MAFAKKTISDVDVEGKTVFVRADYNVLDDDGDITEELRLKGSLPTLNYLRERNCKIVVASHAGRPEGKRVPALTLAPIAARLSELGGFGVKFVEDSIGSSVDEARANLKAGEVLLLENLRFQKGEEANDSDFAKLLLGDADLFVQDGFGVVHRAHASTDAIARQGVPSVAGLLLAKEVRTITDALETPERPLIAIVGGSKVSTKLEVLDALMDRVDHLVIGGAMANTFFAHPEYGIKIGQSLYEPEMMDEVGRVLNEAKDRGEDFLILPTDDVAVAKEKSEDAEAAIKDLKSLDGDDIILDFGPESTQKIVKALGEAQSILWNGPLGYTENEQFAFSSLAVARAIASSGADSIVGGGDTAAFVEKHELVENFSHVSTGGGASLELMAGKSLPGVEVLEAL